MIARAAGIAVLVLGAFAALNQLEIAPEIVNGLFYAMLIAIVGSVVVAFGGGGIPSPGIPLALEHEGPRHHDRHPPERRHRGRPRGDRGRGVERADPVATRQRVLISGRRPKP